MTKEHAFKIERIQPVAEELRKLLLPVCDMIEIAGSIRRCQDLVSDIEIVAVPRMGPEGGLLFDSGKQISKLESRLKSLVEDPWLCAGGRQRSPQGVGTKIQTAAIYGDAGRPVCHHSRPVGSDLRDTHRAC